MLEIKFTIPIDEIRHQLKQAFYGTVIGLSVIAAAFGLSYWSAGLF